MNKLGIASLSVLGTLGVVAGAGAVALTNPNVREKLNISWYDSGVVQTKEQEKNEKTQLQETINTLTQERDELTARVTTLTNDKTSLNNQVTLLTELRNTLNTQLATLNSQIALLNAQHQAENEENEATISALEEELLASVTDYESQIANLNTTITELNQHITEINDEVSSLNSEIDELTQQLELTQQGDFSQILNNHGFVLVNYIVDEEITPTVCKVGTATEFFGKPRKPGYSCIGWSKTPDGNNMIANVDESCDLYPVFVRGNYQITIHNMDNSTWSPMLSDITFTNLNYMSDNFSFGMAGISTSPDEINLVKSFERNGEYYGIFYCSKTNTIMSLNEAERFKDLMIYGESAFYNVTVVDIDGTYEGEARGLMNYNQFVSINGIQYLRVGFCENPTDTSFTIGGIEEMRDNTLYYVVYLDMATGLYYTSEQLSAGFDVTVHTYYFAENISYSDMYSYDSDFIVDGVNFQFLGWSDDVASTVTYTTEEVMNNGFKNVFAIYLREDTNEVYTWDQLTTFKNNYRVRVYAYDGQHIFVHILSNYEIDLEKNGVNYEFVGWALGEDSTETVDISQQYNGNFIYSVYRNSNTQELLTWRQFVELYNS